MVENLVIENARILYPNFAGKEDRYNRAGNRNFIVVIPDEMVERLLADGWNVKTRIDDGEDEPRYYYLQVTVSYKVAPPKIYLITRTNKTALDEDGVEALDYAEIKGADLIINPYAWEVNGKSGIKAYLKTAYVVIEEDEFAYKYADLD